MDKPWDINYSKIPQQRESSCAKPRVDRQTIYRICKERHSFIHIVIINIRLKYDFHYTKSHYEQEDSRENYELISCFQQVRLNLYIHTRMSSSWINQTSWIPIYICTHLLRFLQIHKLYFWSIFVCINFSRSSTFHRFLFNFSNRE